MGLFLPDNIPERQKIRVPKQVGVESLTSQMEGSSMALKNFFPCIFKWGFKNRCSKLNNPLKRAFKNSKGGT